MSINQQLQRISEQFEIQGDYFDGIPFGSGHINDTYLISTTVDNYILQRLNNHIFKNIEQMNRNIILALDHLYKKQDIANDKRFRKLDIAVGRDGKNHFKDEYGNYWRMMNFISNTVSFDVVEDPKIAFEAAKGLGYFQKMIIDLNPEDFFPSIPDFHNLAMRIETYKMVLEKNRIDRNRMAKDEIAFVQAHEYLSTELSELLESNWIPIRLTHNDTKINNVLLDKNTLESVAVIDLDTVMPGTILFDFGDMIRTYSSPAEEDEKDLSKVVLRIDIFKAFARGYLSELKNVLTTKEVENLVFGGKVMTFMIGLRFLTDFLEGDGYFKTSRDNQNLDRCRTQFKLLHEIEKNEKMLQKIIADV